MKRDTPDPFGLWPSGSRTILTPKAIDEVLKLESHVSLLNLLFEHLPNLRSIGFRDQSVTESSIKNMIRATQASRNEPHANHALSKVVTISFYNTQGGRADFTLLTQWACLPSLRLIQDPDVHSFQDAEGLVGKYLLARKSNAIALEVTESMINDNDNDLDTLLCAIKDLHTFKYEYGFLNNSEGSCRASRPGYEERNIRAVIDILYNYASHSLVVLDLAITNIAKLSHRNRFAGKIFVGSLEPSRRLEKLRADTVIFVESEVEKLLITYVLTYLTDSHDEPFVRIMNEAEE